MKLHFTNEWLRDKIKSDPDDIEPQAGRELNAPIGEGHINIKKEISDAIGRAILREEGRVSSNAVDAATEAALSAIGAAGVALVPEQTLLEIRRLSAERKPNPDTAFRVIWDKVNAVLNADRRKSHAQTKRQTRISGARNSGCAS